MTPGPKSVFISTEEFREQMSALVDKLQVQNATLKQQLEVAVEALNNIECCTNSIRRCPEPVADEALAKIKEIGKV